MNLRQTMIVVSALGVVASSLFGSSKPQVQALTGTQLKALAAVNLTSNKAAELSVHMPAELHRTVSPILKETASSSVTKDEIRTIINTEPIGFARRVSELKSSSAPLSKELQVSKKQVVKEPKRSLAKAVHEHEKPVHQKVVKAVFPASHRQVTTTATTSTNADLYWLARVVEAEAGGQPQAVKLAVADVILNRVHSPLYPNSIQGVIFQRVNGVYAFTSVANGWIYHQPSGASVMAAKEALYGSKNIVPSALVFYNDAQTSQSNWVKTQPVIATLGAMTFAK